MRKLLILLAITVCVLLLVVLVRTGPEKDSDSTDVSIGNDQDTRNTSSGATGKANSKTQTLLQSTTASSATTLTGKTQSDATATAEDLPTIVAIRGIVFNAETRRPISAAMVEMTTHKNNSAEKTKFKTDDVGAFEYTAASGERFEILAAADGYKQYILRNFQTRRTNNMREIPMEPYQRLAGRIVDEANKGIESARVTILRQGEEIGRSAITDSEGYFSIDKIDAAGTYMLSSKHASYQPLEESVSVPTADPIVLHMIPGVEYGRLSITARDRQGNPVEGFQLSLREQMGDGSYQPGSTIATTRDGTAAVDKLKVGVYSWQHNLVPGYMLVPETHSFTIKANETLSVQFLFEKLQTFHFVGRLIDQTSQPVPGAILMARPSDPAAKGFGAGKSDSEGKFDVEVSDDGTYTLTVRQSDFLTLSQPDVKPNETELILIMQSGLSLAGSLKTSNGDVIETFRLRFVSTAINKESKNAAVTAKDGLFLIKGIPADSYQLILELPDKRKFSAPLEMYASSRADLLIDETSGELKVVIR